MEGAEDGAPYELEGAEAAGLPYELEGADAAGVP